MRSLVLILVLLCGAMASAATRVPRAGSAKVDFAKDVRPILDAHCKPCHFEGGAVYAKMPFDRADTIYRLGTKLFTRIQDEKEQRVIRAFLAEHK
jgi:hypothetical protein